MNLKVDKKYFIIAALILFQLAAQAQAQAPIFLKSSGDLIISVFGFNSGTALQNDQSNYGLLTPTNIYDPDFTNLLARFNTAPPDTIKTIFNQLFLDLKNINGYNAYNDIFALYIFAVQDSISALLCWNNATYNLTPSAAGTILFTQYKGITFNGSTGYCNTNFNDTTFTLKSQLIGVYVLTNGTPIAYIAETGVTNNTVFTHIESRGTGISHTGILVRSQSALLDECSSSQAKGFNIFSRLPDDSVRIFKNDTLQSITKTATNSKLNLNYYIGGINFNNSLLVPTNRQLAAVIYCKGETSDVSIGISQAINKLMRSLGANVY